VIEGRIIRIFDNQTIALNVGASHGVKVGMRFGIYTPYEQIIDPETGAVLGQTRRRKAVVEASSVQNLFTIAIAPTRVVRVSSIAASLSALQGETERRQETLPIASGETQPYETGSELRVGDRVEEIVRADRRPGTSAPTAEAEARGSSADR
jgi:hypothetical protein